MKEKNLLQAIRDRRTYYAIGGGAAAPEKETIELIQQAVLHVPSAFNSQSGRIVVLWGDAHKKLWDITEKTLRAIVPAEHFSTTAAKLASFAAGHGTILYFNDEKVTAGFMQKFPTYSANFPIWAQQANGMLQYAIWMLLEEQGYGVSMQHYNPLIDDQVRKEWKLPESWKLLAEMPFGAPTGEPDKKEYSPLDERLKVFGL
jgi:uncharacterized protein